MPICHSFPLGHHALALEAKVVMIGGIGHSPMIEAPEKTPALITGLIATPGPEGGDE